MTIGWRALALVGALSIAACGEAAQFENKCQQITNERCNRDSVCQGSLDFNACASNHEATWDCDPDATLEMMDACITQLDPQITPCSTENLMPDVCYDVLCSASFDCDFVTDVGTETPGTAPTQ